VSSVRQKVVLCADDFGLSEAVSRGILELAHMGRVSATSAMTNCPAWACMAGDLKPLDGAIGVGLHLTLTAGAPLGPMPRFAPGGVFPSSDDLLRQALTRRLPPDEIGAEIRRQLRAFEEAFGRPPNFVDGHQHVHVLPGIRGELLRALRDAGYAGLWLRDPSDDVQAIVRRGISSKKALVVRALSFGFARAARAAGFDTNEGFSGFSPFEPQIDTAQMFERAFRWLGPRPVVMCHPGYVDDELKRLDPVLEPRLLELDYLASDAFAQLLDVRGVELIPSP
jgi:chitin disaccharide deacetylase